MFKKIWKWVRVDGLLHFETCALIAFVVAAFLPWWSGGIAAAVAGIGKELWDKTHGGKFEGHDLICDGVGAVLGMVISLIGILL